MFFIPKDHAPGRALRDKISLKPVADALARIDLWDQRWPKLLRAEVAAQGAALFDEAQAYLPDLRTPDVYRWMLESCRDKPEDQWVWMTIVGGCRPELRSLVAEGAKALECTDAVFRLLLADPGDPGDGTKPVTYESLPKSLKHSSPRVALNMCAAGFFLNGGRDVREFLRTLETLPQFDESDSTACWDSIAARLEALGIEPLRCSPEAVLLQRRAGTVRALLRSAAAKRFFDLDGVPPDRLEGLSTMVGQKLLDKLCSFLSKGDFAQPERLLRKAFGSVPANELPAELKETLRSRFVPEDPFEGKNVRALCENWSPMSDAFANWLRAWLGLEPAPWAFGCAEAVLELLGQKRIVEKMSGKTMEKFHRLYGLPALKAMAEFKHAQTVTSQYPQAYEDMRLERVFEVMPNRTTLERIVFPRLDDEAFLRLMAVRGHRDQKRWLQAYLTGKDGAAQEALKRRMVEEIADIALQWLSPGDPVWLQLGFGTLMQPRFKDVVKAQIKAISRMEGPADAFLGRLFDLKNAVGPLVMKGAPSGIELLGILMRHTSMRRRMVTDHLDERMVRIIRGRDGWCTEVRILGTHPIAVEKVAGDMLLSKTFHGSGKLRNEIVCEALRAGRLMPKERLRLLRLAMRLPDRLDVLTRPELHWERDELMAAAPFVTRAYVDDYLGLTGIAGLEALFACSSEIVSGRHRFELCRQRFARGLIQPVRRQAYEPADDEDRCFEAACEVFSLTESNVRQRTEGWLERLGGDAQRVLDIVLMSQDRLPDALMRLLEEALERLDVAPESRLDYMLWPTPAVALNWWPPEGPSGEKGLIYKVMRVHHRVVSAAAALPEDEVLVKRILSLMHRHWSNDAAWLELAIALGREHAPLLRELIGRTDWSRVNGERYDACYARWRIPKKNGGEREIHAPSAVLKAVQRLVNEKILQPLGAHDAAWGFVPGRGIAGNAAQHVGRPVLACADIHACFPSVGRRLVMHVLRRDLGDRFSDTAVMRLADIVLAEGVLPTGAPTSPAILNRVLLKTDEILSEAAQQRQCVYTRYADDLAFSGGEDAVSLLGIARGVLGGIGLKLDPKKTNVFRRGRRQCCTGLVVNDKVSVRRGYARRLRAAVHAVACGRAPTLDGEPLTIMMLKGHIAFLESVKPEEGARLRARLAEALAKEGGRHDG